FLASFAVFFVMILRPYICTLFPYTTLFRSYFCILYSSIIANEVVNDRTTRINELLFAMSSARIQLIGKIVGLYVLLIIQLAMLTVATIFLAEWQRHFSLYIPSIFNAIYFIFNILFATFFGLIWTVQIAVCIDDNTQTA